MKKKWDFKPLWVALLIAGAALFLFRGPLCFGTESYSFQRFMPEATDSARLYYRSFAAAGWSSQLLNVRDSLGTTYLYDSIDIDETYFHEFRIVWWPDGSSRPYEFRPSPYFPSAQVTGTVNANIVSANTNSIEDIDIATIGVNVVQVSGDASAADSLEYLLDGTGAALTVNRLAADKFLIVSGDTGFYVSTTSATMPAVKFLNSNTGDGMQIVAGSNADALELDGDAGTTGGRGFYIHGDTGMFIDGTNGFAPIDVASPSGGYWDITIDSLARAVNAGAITIPDSIPARIDSVFAYLRDTLDMPISELPTGDSIYAQVATVATDSSDLYQGTASLDSAAVYGAIVQFNEDSVLDVNVATVSTGAIEQGDADVLSVNMVQIDGDADAAKDLKYLLDGTGVTNDVDLTMRSMTINNADGATGLAIAGATTGMSVVGGSYGLGVAGGSNDIVGDIDGTIDSVAGIPATTATVSSTAMGQIAQRVKDTATVYSGVFYGPTASGSGTETIIIYAIDSSQTPDVAKQGVKVTVKNKGGSTVAAQTTNSGGYATFYLDADPINPYTIIGFDPGFFYNSRTLTVTGDNDSVALKGYDTHSPGRSIVYGYIDDIMNNQVGAAWVYAQRINCKNATIDGGGVGTTKGIAGYVMRTPVDTGYFSMELINSDEYDQDSCGYYNIWCGFDDSKEGEIWRLNKVWLTSDLNVMDSLAARN
jgi:hypothetical protein